MAEARVPQQTRSRRTREKLLTACVEVVMRAGYSHAGLPAICAAAGVSRGAQLHHFPTKIEMLCAAVEYLMERRLAVVRGMLRDRTEMPPVDVFVDALWAIYTGDAFYVWNELCTVARTDEPLREKLAEVNDRFYAEVHALLADVLPDRSPREIRGAGRYLTSLMNGLAINRVLDDDDESSQAALDVLRQGLTMYLHSQGD